MKTKTALNRKTENINKAKRTGRSVNVKYTV